VLGHSTRLKGSGSVKLNEKWRTELSAADLRVFEALAGRQNRTLGYQSSSVAMARAAKWVMKRAAKRSSSPAGR
jgi:hypothetical protein